jgi:hypothetical protein
MSMPLTPDGQIVAAVLAVAALCVPLWIFAKARRNGGVAELPSGLMFGWGGAAWGQSCIVIDRDTWHKGPLIAHERCHQQQMARDGTHSAATASTAATICPSGVRGMDIDHSFFSNFDGDGGQRGCCALNLARTHKHVLPHGGGAAHALLCASGVGHGDGAVGVGGGHGGHGQGGLGQQLAQLAVRKTVDQG